MAFGKEGSLSRDLGYGVIHVALTLRDIELGPSGRQLVDSR